MVEEVESGRDKGGTDDQRTCRWAGREVELITTRLLVSNWRDNFVVFPPRQNLIRFPMPLFHPRFFLSLAVLLLAPAARAAEALGAPAPLTVTLAPPAPGESLEQLYNAQWMLESGFAADAAAAFEKLLTVPVVPGANHNTLVLLLVSARLNQGDTAAAERALGDYEGVRTAAYHLRAGLIAARLGKAEVARAEATLTVPTALPADDQAWYYFLQGMMALTGNDNQHALTLFTQAESLAASEVQRARITVARELTLLQAQDVSEAKAAELLAAAERDVGKRTGYSSARLYAAALFALGHTAEAVAYLRSQLRVLPAAQHKERDDFLLLLGVGTRGRPGEGRNALEKLIEDGDNPGHQSAALQLLADVSTDGPVREEFRTMLDKRIAGEPGSPPHPILAELLLARAQLALGDRRWTSADDDANNLLTKFPGKLTAAALGVRLTVAWVQKHYRLAADYATKARDALPATAAAQRAALGVLVAEARFRAGEAEGDAKLFEGAADAYATALSERPAEIGPGELIYQQALALTRAGLHEEAGKLLDRFAVDTRLDPASRWQAEWNLARALQTAGDTELARQDNLRHALKRVGDLLLEGGTPGGFSAELRLQMGWLQARLTLDAGEAPQAQTLAQTLYERVKAMPGLADAARNKLAAHALLLQAQATLALKVPSGDAPAEAARDEQGLNLLKKLWKEYRMEEAAMQGYFIGADYFAGGERNQIVMAQELLQKVVDDFHDDKINAPRALFFKARYEAQLGQSVNKKNALMILDELLGKYPDSELEFSVRKRQAELHNDLGQYPQAQDIYLLLTRTFVGHSQYNEIRLALAAAYQAEGQLDLAGNIYLSLRDYVNATPDVRAEAACRLGELRLAQRDKTGAKETWLALALTFLPPAPSVAPELGVTGRFWLDRALLRCGELLAQDGQLDEALMTYAMVEEYGLPSHNLAHERRVELGGVSPR